VPAFWGLVVAFAGYGLAFSAMSFHLIPLLAERKVEIGVVMAIIALIGPMQVVGRVLLMAAQNASAPSSSAPASTSPFPMSMAMLAMGISDVYGLILFAIVYGVANGLVTILRGMAVPEFIGPEGYGVVSGRAHHADQHHARRRPADGRLRLERVRQLHAGAVGPDGIMLVRRRGFRRGGTAVEEAHLAEV
jgi:hypothetical protein